MKDRDPPSKFQMVIIMVFGILILFSILGLIVLGVANAEVSKNTLTNLREKINELESSIKEQKETIDEKRIQVINNEKRLREYIIEERTLRVQTLSNWTAIPELEKLESKISKFAPKVAIYKKNLTELRLDLIEKEKNHNILLNSLVDMETQYINENKPDLSSLERLIGIQLSNSCITAIKNNITNPCHIDYEDLLQFDSSLVEVSGNFIRDGNFFHRDKPIYKNNCRLYDHDKGIRIIIDPSSHCDTRIKIIELRPNFDTYTLTDSLTQQEEFEFIDVKINQTFSKKEKVLKVRNQTQTFGIIQYHDRYIDSCRVGYINADKWQLLLADTIHHMRSNCSNESTSFNTKEIIPLEYVEHDISTSKDFQHKAWLSNVINFCIYKYQACTE